MKKLYLLIILVIYATLSFGQSRLLLNKYIRGMVNEVTLTTYECEEKFGEPVKGKFKSSSTSYYDKQGLLIKRTYSDGDVFTYSYENNKTKRLEYKNNKLNEVEECNFSSSNRSEIYKRYDASGTLKEAIRYNYDDKGYTISKIIYDKSGVQQDCAKILNNINGFPTNKTADISSATIKYDKFNNEIKEVIEVYFLSVIRIISEYSILKYDNNGNWVTQVYDYTEGADLTGYETTKQLQERYIVYYDGTTSGNKAP